MRNSPSRLVPRSLAAILGVVTMVAIVAPQADAASLIADYRFDDNLSSSVGTAPPLTQIPPLGTYSTATVNGAPDRVLSFPEGGGLQFLRSAVPNPAAYSTVVTFAFDDVTGYRRILAFDTYGADNDNGFYGYFGDLDFYDDTTDETTGTGAPLADGVFSNVAFTRTADGRAAAFANGVNHVVHPDVNGQSVIGIDGLRYFKDNANDEDGSGSVARIRIYDGALTDAEVLDIEQLGGLRASATSTGKPQAIRRKKRKPPKSVVAGISLTCPAEAVACPFSAEILATKKGKPRSIGRLSGEVPAGGASSVTVKLTKSGRRLIGRKGKLPITANATVTAGSGMQASATSMGNF